MTADLAFVLGLVAVLLSLVAMAGALYSLHLTRPHRLRSAPTSTALSRLVRRRGR